LILAIQTASPATQTTSLATQTISPAAQTSSPATQTTSLATRTTSPATQTTSLATQTISPIIRMAFQFIFTGFLAALIIFLLMRTIFLENLQSFINSRTKSIDFVKPYGYNLFRLNFHGSAAEFIYTIFLIFRSSALRWGGSLFSYKL